jgi:hypothetical protein
MQEMPTREQVREWLRKYAWAENSERDKDMVVECIMMQDRFRYLDVLADRYASAQWEPGPEAFAEGVEFEMSALYECHTGPHIPVCPNYKGDEDLDDEDMCEWDTTCDHGETSCEICGFGPQPDSPSLQDRGLNLGSYGD